MVNGYNIGVRNHHKADGTYEFHIHRAYIIYAASIVVEPIRCVHRQYIIASGASA